MRVELALDVERGRGVRGSARDSFWEGVVALRTGDAMAAIAKLHKAEIKDQHDAPRLYFINRARIAMGGGVKEEELAIEAAKAPPVKVEEPKVEEPKVEELQVEQPKSDKPKHGLLEAVVLKGRSSRGKEPKAEKSAPAEIKQEEAPNLVEPKPEAPKEMAPKAEAPKAEVPKPEIPKPERPPLEVHPYGQQSVTADQHQPSSFVIRHFMAPLDYPAPIQRLIVQLKRLPGIGPRSAERMALWLLQGGRDHVLPLAGALQGIAEQVEMCHDCGFFLQLQTDCLLCTNEKRNRHIICVVEQAADVLRMERSRAYQGQYHVLGGKLSPLDNVTPDDLRIESLVRRVAELPATEVILALSSDVEGEATAHYLADALRTASVNITRLAQGMPAGGGLDHVDELTLYQALHGRRTV